MPPPLGHQITIPCQMIHWVTLRRNILLKNQNYFHYSRSIEFFFFSLLCFSRWSIDRFAQRQQIRLSIIIMPFSIDWPSSVFPGRQRARARNSSRGTHGLLSFGCLHIIINLCLLHHQPPSRWLLSFPGIHHCFTVSPPIPSKSVHQSDCS